MSEPGPDLPERRNCPRCGLNVPLEAITSGDHVCGEELLEAREKLLTEQKIAEDMAALEQEWGISSPHLKFEEYYLRRKGRLLNSSGEERKK